MCTLLSHIVAASTPVANGAGRKRKHMQAGWESGAGFSAKSYA
jgi:hypothetical protein